MDSLRLGVRLEALSVTLSLRSLSRALHNVPTLPVLHVSCCPAYRVALFGSMMRDHYATGRIHPESPVSGDAVIRVIADMEVLLQAAYAGRWPAHATMQIGDTAVLRCTSRLASGTEVYSEVLIDVSMDRLQRQPVKDESHVLFRAWLRSEASAEVVHAGVERVTNQAWIVETFSPGEWVQTLREMARDASTARREPSDHWSDDDGRDQDRSAWP